MDENLKALIDYAREELDEAERLRAEDVISDDGVFVRLFLVGKSLVGWDSDLPVDVAIEFCKRINKDVMEMVDDILPSQDLS